MAAQRHTAVGTGTFAYAFLLTTDPSSWDALISINQPAHGISADVVAAFHFRNADNSGPNQVGPKNVNAPQAYRQLRYHGYQMEIRVLETDIINLGEGAIPAFASLSVMLTVTRRPTANPSSTEGERLEGWGTIDLPTQNRPT